jgi:7-cyano-7-deazaguanine synthase
MKRAIVLLSGGVDSTTTLAIAKAEGFDVYALSFDYGQKHVIELDSARANSLKLDVKDFLVISFNLRDIGGSALTSDIQVPKDRLHLSEPSDSVSLESKTDDIPVTYVPARNTIFLSFSLAWAESIGASDIFIGANAVDYSGYPDCRPEYIKSFENMANLATKASVNGTIRFKINAPLINMTKAEIIKKAVELNVDLSETWSCYAPENEKYPCRRCDSCLLRAKGFKEADIEDPLLSKVKH